MLSTSSHRPHPLGPKDYEVLSSCHPDPDTDLDMSPFDRSHGSGHGPVYVDKFNWDDHMKANSPRLGPAQGNLQGACALLLVVAIALPHLGLPLAMNKLKHKPTNASLL